MQTLSYFFDFIQEAFSDIIGIFISVLFAVYIFSISHDGIFLVVISLMAIIFISNYLAKIVALYLSTKK